MKKRVEQRLQFAKIDIESAELLNKREYLTQAAAFHCQQAVEKIFKGMFEAFEENVPQIHNIEVYTDTRYPSDVGLIPL